MIIKRETTMFLWILHLFVPKIKEPCKYRTSLLSNIRYGLLKKVKSRLRICKVSVKSTDILL